MAGVKARDSGAAEGLPQQNQSFEQHLEGSNRAALSFGYMLAQLVLVNQVRSSTARYGKSCRIDKQVVFIVIY